MGGRDGDGEGGLALGGGGGGDNGCAVVVVCCDDVGCYFGGDTSGDGK